MHGAVKVVMSVEVDMGNISEMGVGSYIPGWMQDQACLCRPDFDQYLWVVPTYVCCCPPFPCQIEVGQSKVAELMKV